MDISSAAWFRGVVGAVCGAITISALATGGLALAQAKPAWFLLMFEIVVVTAGVFGVLLATGRFRGTTAMTLACVSVCIGAGTLLGYVGTGKTVAGFNLRNWFLARELGAAILAAGAGAVLIVRGGRPSLRALSIGAVLTAIFGGLVVASVGLSNTSLWIDMPGAAKVAIVLAGGALMLGVFSAAVHWMIKAFALGNEDAARASA